MSIKLNDNIEARGPFGLMDDSQISGSFRVVSFISDMNNIPSYVRKAGMYVNVYGGGATGSLFMLKDDMTTWISIGSGSSGLIPTGSAGTYYGPFQTNLYGQVTSASLTPASAGGGTLSASYVLGTSAADSTLLLDRVRKGLALDINVPAFAEDPFSISSGSTNLLRVDSSGNLYLNNVAGAVLTLNETILYTIPGGNSFNISSQNALMTINAGGFGIDILSYTSPPEIIPNSDNALALGSAGARWTDLYASNGYQVSPGGYLKNIVQGSTNTVGLTIAPNVADGASTIGLLVNCVTDIATGVMVQFQNSGSVRGSITDLGGGLGAYYFGPYTSNDYIYGGNNTLNFRTAGSTGLIIAGSTVVPGTSGSSLNGSLTSPWGQLFSITGSFQVVDTPNTHQRLLVGGPNAAGVGFFGDNVLVLPNGNVYVSGTTGIIFDSLTAGIWNAVASMGLSIQYSDLAVAVYGGAIGSYGPGSYDCGSPGNYWRDVRGQHFIGKGTSPSGTLGGGAGTGASYTISGSDAYHLISLTVGSSPHAGDVVMTGTFARQYDDDVEATPNAVVIQAANAASAMAMSGVYVDSNYVFNQGGLGYAIRNVGSALTPNTTFKFWVSVGG